MFSAPLRAAKEKLDTQPRQQLAMKPADLLRGAGACSVGGMKPLLIEIETTHGVDVAYSASVQPRLDFLLMGAFHAEPAPQPNRLRAFVRGLRNAVGDRLYRIADAVSCDRRDDY